MSNMEKYKQAFIEAFEAEPETVESYVFGETEGWDSIGHMSLVVALEDAFGVEFEPEDMTAITSYQKGIEILRGKGVEF